MERVCGYVGIAHGVDERSNRGTGETRRLRLGGGGVLSCVRRSPEATLATAEEGDMEKFGVVAGPLSPLFIVVVPML